MKITNKNYTVNMENSSKIIMLHNDNWLQSNLKFYYYTSHEFPIQNFHRRTTDILYYNGIELSIIVSFSYLDLVFIPGVF